MQSPAQGKIPSTSTIRVIINYLLPFESPNDHVHPSQNQYFVENDLIQIQIQFFSLVKS